MPAASSSLIDPAVGQLVPAAQSPGQEPAWLPDARRHRHHHAGRRDRGQLQHDEVLHHRGPIPGGPEPAGGGGDGRRQPGRSERLEAGAHTVTVAAAARRAGSASPAAGPGWWPGRPRRRFADGSWQPPGDVEGQTGGMGDLRAVAISETPRPEFASQTSGTFSLGWWNTWRRIGDRANVA
jgi:hypothetical protein